MKTVFIQSNRLSSFVAQSIGRVTSQESPSDHKAKPFQISFQSLPSLCPEYRNIEKVDYSKGKSFEER